MFTCELTICQLNTPDIKFAYTINDLGWYSYKIVVKQTEQEYYNVYLPGILNGYPFPQTTASVPQGFGGNYWRNGAFPTNEVNNNCIYYAV